jgi:hypothetical protein
VAVGQSQRLYSGVGIFNWYYLSSPPQIPRRRGVPLETRGLTSVILIQVAPPGVFFMCFYNHAHRLRLEKQFFLALYRSPNGYFKVLLDPGGGFTIETAARRSQK